MFNDNLILKSDSLYKKSQKLLSDFDFIEIAGKYFKPVGLVGSASCNLMIDADIDINCYAKTTDKKVILNFVNDLLKIKKCRKVILYNETFNKKPFFIVNVEKFDYQGERWIITFYISSNVSDKPDLLNKLKYDLDEEKRETILMIKKYREENKQKRSISSNIIYFAVIERNVNTIEEFKKHLSSLGIDPDKKDDY